MGRSRAQPIYMIKIKILYKNPYARLLLGFVRRGSNNRESSRLAALARLRAVFSVG
jgi:hypothetical protein